MTNQEAIEILEETGFVAHSMTDVDTALDMAIEALKAKRPKGKWIDIPYIPSHTKYMCSECGKAIYTNSEYIKEQKFCFSCGADMRGEEE